MKKYLLKAVSLFLLVGMLTSCEEEKTIFKGGEMARFEEKTVAFPMSPEDSVLEIVVSSTKAVDFDRSIIVDVVAENTTATSDMFTIDTTSKIAAGEYTGVLRVVGNFDALPDVGMLDLALNLVSVGDAQIDPNGDVVTISLYKVCETNDDLSGTHSYTLYDVTSGDGAGGGTNYPTYSASGTVTWTVQGAVANGTYINSDITFGLFPAFGYAAPAKKIKWICNRIDVLESDQYGDTYTYTINSCIGNVMELYFVNTWGDAGHVTLMRDGGADWPELLQTN